MDAGHRVCGHEKRKSSTIWNTSVFHIITEVFTEFYYVLLEFLQNVLMVHVLMH